MASKRVGSIHVEMSLNSAKVVTGAEESKRAVREATREMKANVAEAKATIALLGEEIGVKLPRHVRGFVASIPGVAPALAAAFSGVAVLTIGTVLVEAGEKMVKFAEKSKNAAKEIYEAWRETIAQSTKQGIELDLVNDKLDNQIAKLEHKPANLLKLALDEDRKAAHDLSEELEKADANAKKVLKDKSLGFLGATVNAFTGGDTQRTGFVESDIKAAYAKLKEVQEAAEDAQNEAKPGDDAMAVKLKNRVNILKAYAHEVSLLSNSLAMTKLIRSADPKNEDFSATEALQATALREMRNEQHNIQAGYDAADKEEEAKALEQKEALRKYGEAEATKASQRQIRGFELQLGIIKGYHALELGEETDFWARMLRAKHLGADAQRFVLEKLGTATQQEYHQINEIAAKAVAEQKKQAAENVREFATLTSIMDQWDEVERIGADSTNQLNVILAKNRDELRQVQLAHDVATGGVSRYDAAVETAAMHTREANDELARLRAELKGVQDSPGIRSVAQANKVAELQQKIASLEGARDRQKEVDEWAIAQTTAFGGINEAMGEMVARAKDVSGQMRDAFVSAISSVNGEILKSITGESTDWKKVANGIFANISKHALETAEGSILGSLGFGGKADGSSEANALWVRMHGAAAESLAGNIGSSIFDSFKKDDSGDDSGSGGKGNWFSNLFSSLMPHASGGPISAGLAYMVGERGPEPFFPGVSGSMGTHEAMQAAFGGGGGAGDLHFHIDARHSTDPAQTRALVQQGIMEMVPHILKASVKANADFKRRKVGGGS
jgi:hypothetical protein